METVSLYIFAFISLLVIYVIVKQMFEKLPDKPVCRVCKKPVETTEVQNVVVANGIFGYIYRKRYMCSHCRKVRRIVLIVLAVIAVGILAATIIIP